MKRIACVHGINTSVAERQRFALRWQDILRAGGLAVECVAVPWSSHGHMGGDIAGLMSPTTGEQWSREVATGIDASGADVVLAHSGGTILMHGKKHTPVSMAGKRIVAIGSPWGHPFWSNMLGMSAWKPAPFPVVDIWNKDDPIACSFATSHRSPRGWRGVEVKHPGHTIEHSDEIYLRSPVALATLREVLEA